MTDRRSAAILGPMGPITTTRGIRLAVRARCALNIEPARTGPARLVGLTSRLNIGSCLALRRGKDQMVVIVYQAIVAQTIVKAPPLW
jgi:hypothetical protein